MDPGEDRARPAPLPDFLALAREAHVRLGEDGAAALLEAGRRWDLAPVLRANGSVIFPHAGIDTCGHQIAAAVHACLDCGADRVLALGVLHARTPEIRSGLDRVAAGGDPAREPLRGVQGPGLSGRGEWRGEWSLAHFEFLWRMETRRRNVAGPELVLRYPFLVGGRPADLPGIAELEELAPGAATGRRGPRAAAPGRGVIVRSAGESRPVASLPRIVA